MTSGLRRFVLYAALNGIGTLAHYATLVALVEALEADPVVGSACGFAVGGLVNYALSYAVVFRSDKRHGEALAKFFTVAGLGLAWNSLLMAALVNGAGLPYLAAQVLTTAVLLLWHYGGNALWTFRRS